MRTFTRHIECGIYSFDVAIDRDIAVKAMEEYPNICDFIFTTAKESAQKMQEEKSDKIPDDVDIFIEQLRGKNMSKLLDRDAELQECVKFIFPMMLKKGGSNLNAQDIINYIYENQVDAEFNAGIYEMVLLGFTQREVHNKKKVNFSMK